MQKTIKISPELFTLNKNKKKNTNKNKTLKTKDNKSDFKINLKTNKVKQKLLEKIKDYQKNKQENNNHTTDIEDNNNFSESLTFLENLTTKHKKDNLNNNNQSNLNQSNLNQSNFNQSNNNFRNNSLLNKSLKIRKNDNNNDIKLELPSELNSNIEVVNINTKTYGCLKNGNLPTYREWKRLTQKNNNRENLPEKRNNQLSLKINTDLNTYSENAIANRENAIANRENAIANSENTIANSENTILDRGNKLNNLKMMYKNNNTNNNTNNTNNTNNNNNNNTININNTNNDKSKNLLDKDINTLNLDNCNIEKNINIKENIINTKLDNNFKNLEIQENITIDCESNKNKSNIDSISIDTIDLESDREDNIQSSSSIPKIIRNTKTYKYKLGKNKKSKNIGIFIKNRSTLKNIKKDFNELKNVNINEVKKYLRKHNLIKTGTIAPNDVLRQLYENSILSGEIINNNTNNMIYNYIND